MMKRKEQKLAECRHIKENDIMPKLKEIKDDYARLQEFKGNERDLERLQKI